MVNKTFAIITDIHSNISALSEAMEIIKSRDNIDQIICLGDCFSLGPEPEKTLEKLKEVENCIFVRGNHDRYIIERLWEEELPTLEGMDPYDPICKAIVENEKWTRNLIENRLENWDITRIALIDLLVLQMMITEMVFIKDVPPKVSISEGIEIVKKFSTDESSSFVNGILDSVFHSLEDLSVPGH